MSIATEAVMKQEVYQVNGMNLWYGQHHALKNINLSIYEMRLRRLSDHPDAGNRPLSRH